EAPCSAAIGSRTFARQLLLSTASPRPPRKPTIIPTSRSAGTRSRSAGGRTRSAPSLKRTSRWLSAQTYSPDNEGVTSRSALVAVLTLVFAPSAAAHPLPQAPDCPVFPATSVWNKPVDQLPLRKDSRTLVN